MSVDVSAVYKSTIEHFKQAQKNIAIEKECLSIAPMPFLM